MFSVNINGEDYEVQILGGSYISDIVGEKDEFRFSTRISVKHNGKFLTKKEFSGYPREVMDRILLQALRQYK